MADKDSWWKTIVEKDREGYRENINKLRKEILQLKYENRLIEKYEEALIEVVEQKGLMNFLDENEWATTEDYFAHLGREALKD